MPLAATTVSLSSRGVPSEQPLLNCSWVRSAEEPWVNNAPHFVSTGGKGAAASIKLHLYLGRDGMWQIAPEVGARLAYAVARSPARHPNTVRAGEWLLPKPPDGVWLPATDFHLRHEGPNTELQPYTLDDLGCDFFLRVKTTKLVWFVDPSTGETVHSGAKGAGSKGKPGKRYCPQCKLCFSANNFVSQHLKNLHTPPPPSPPTVGSDGTGGALLAWRVDNCPPGAQPVGYLLECSTDGGLTFETLVEDTGSAEPRARLTSLNLSKSYQFRIAAHSSAVLGPHGPASAAFTPGGAAGSGIALAVGGGAAQPQDAASAARTDLVDAYTPPTSPPPYPATMPPLAGGGEMPSLTSGGGGKRAREVEPAEEKPELLSGDTEELLWTLEELVACTNDPMSASSASASKRPRPADGGTAAATAAALSAAAQSSGSLPPLAALPMDGAIAPRAAAPTLTRAPSSSGFGASEPELFLQSLLASFAEEPQQPNYRSADTWAARPKGPPPPTTPIPVVYSRRSPGAFGSNGFGAPTIERPFWAESHAAEQSIGPPNGHTADTESVQRLVRLRTALQKAPPGEISKRISSDLLSKVGAAGAPLSRELTLLLTYADPAAAAEAAGMESHVHDTRAALTCNPGMLPLLVPPPPSSASNLAVVDASKPRAKPRAASSGDSSGGGVPLLVVISLLLVGALFAVTQPPEALTLALATVSAAVSPPPAAPTCRFAWKRMGCAASDGSRGFCRLKQLGACEPRAVA